MVVLVHAAGPGAVGAAHPADSVVAAADAEAMQVGVGPGEGDLDGVRGHSSERTKSYANGL